MTDEERDWYNERVAYYVNIGIVLDIARRLAESDLDLWREYGDEADFSKLEREEDE
jgi:hypothetical protein